MRFALLLALAFAIALASIATVDTITSQAAHVVVASADLAQGGHV